MRYYLHQAGRGKNNGIEPVYATPLVLKRGYGIGCFLSRLWLDVRTIFWSGYKALGQETLRTWGDILTDIARSSSDRNPRDIVPSTWRTLHKIWFPIYGYAVANTREVERLLNGELVSRRDLQKETSLLNRYQSHSCRHVCQYCVRDFRFRYVCF